MSVLRVLFLVVALAGCVGTGTNDWVPTETDVTQSISKIGPVAHSELCSQFDGYVHGVYASITLVEAACTAHALQTTHSAEACGDAALACTHDLPPVVQDQLDQILSQASCSAVSTSSDCKAPVSKMIDCLGALGHKVNEVKFSLTCAAFGSQVPADWWKIQAPEQCIALAKDCPSPGH